MLWGGRREMATSSLYLIDGVPAMPQPNDLRRSLVALDQNSTSMAVIKLSQSSWLVAGMLPGIERQPRKKLEPSPERLTFNAGKHAGNQPARLAQLNDGNDRAILVQSDEGPAQSLPRRRPGSFGWGIAALDRLDAATKLPFPCTAP